MYGAVFRAVRQWLERAEKQYAGIIKFDAADSTPERIICRLETARLIGELNVSEPDFRPYRYAELLVLDTEKDGLQQPAFVYQDSDADTVADILRNLDAGLEMMASADRKL